MPSPGYEKRMEQILAARVAAIEEGERPQKRRRVLSLVLIGPLAAAGMFFLLKAALLAIQGEAAFVGMMAPVAADAGIESLRFWISGIDPLTEALARVLTPLVDAARSG